jgi:hypothetical protein
MEANLTSYGWSGQDVCSIDTVAKTIVFNSEGYVYHDTFCTNKQISKVSADFTWNSIDIGLILWYNNGIGYIKFVSNNEAFELQRVLGDKTTVLYRKENTLQIPDGNPVTIHALLSGTNIQCYVANNQIFNIEQSSFTQGQFGVYGGTGAICTIFRISSNKFDDWSVATCPDGTRVEKFGDTIKFTHRGKDTTYVYIYQDLYDY